MLILAEAGARVLVLKLCEADARIIVLNLCDIRAQMGSDILLN